uniref:METTL21D protein n=1 Tax=Fopius arisanus TaxID=64838 RepID=A0A0C9RX97_9HYME
MESGIFTRIFEVETREKSLTLYQQQVGDVSCVVWDAALVLAKYLDHLCQVEGFGDKWLEEKKVLELGAGTGCVGMTAACLGAHVVMTDLESTMPILRKNISMNEEQWRDSGTARAEVLDWEINPSTPEHFGAPLQEQSHDSRDPLSRRTRYPWTNTGLERIPGESNVEVSSRIHSFGKTTPEVLL